ncbi:DMSO/selenate family reductase complex A subunit [Ferrimonas lipolytica]|uniref:Molybdopterin-dependent oxidoreductase n=1 Tax=Ferrimonas lipolytica TaxID=2724191 RepID=A0A6H1UB43_9GAMM|nr:DMSO/selenate family reductase complex A subunit [Ferrimonas lipolytica]QIZ76297.1 molybdopterin-dependent oxidoreductase [Ferrimonas lipolytica]
MQRRDFLKLSASASAVSCITACGSKDSDTPLPQIPEGSNEQVHWYGCSSNCTSICPIKVITEDGVVTRIETDDLIEDSSGNPQHRACLRGRSARQKVLAAERLTVPMKRVGPRGSGEFVEISWEEAYDTIHANLSRILNEYGNEAVYFPNGSGTVFSTMSGQDWYGAGVWGAKLMNLLGGHLGSYYGYSYAGVMEAYYRTFGTVEATGSSMSVAQESDLIFSLGYNPAETSTGGVAGQFQWQKAIDGIETIVVDPRYTDSMLSGSQWVPIRPGTDAALCEALGYEIITNDKADEAFLNKYCVGYDATTMPETADEGADYKSHILGLGPDGTEKTPEYAERITGIPAATIRKLAEKLWSAERPFVVMGYGPNRHANGEQNVRSVMMLPLLLGKVGLPGTNNGVLANTMYSLPWGIGISSGENPVKATIPFYSWLDAVERGIEMTATSHGVRGAEKLNSNIKFIWNHASNTLVNQHGDTYKCAEVLSDESKVEFILVHDINMTSSAKFADILLPDLMDIERDDLMINSGAESVLVIPATSKVKSIADGRSSFEVCLQLAKRFGLETEYAEGRSYREWLAYSYAVTRGFYAGYFPETATQLPEDFETFMAGEPVRLSAVMPNIALQQYIAGDGQAELPTPSGKIEIYSAAMQELADSFELEEGEEIPAIPKYVRTWEGYEDFETKKDYPLQCFGFHSKGRTHSSYHNLSWLRTAYEDAIWMHPQDADNYGVTDGSYALVASKRGTIKIKVKVTPRIIPGVAALPQGMWFKDVNGVDEGGCINTLTSLRTQASGKGNAQHTILVNVKPA